MVRRYMCTILLLVGCTGDPSSEPADPADAVGSYQFDEYYSVQCDGTSTKSEPLDPIEFLDVTENVPSLVVSMCSTTPPGSCGEWVTFGSDGDAWRGTRTSAQTFENGRVCQLVFERYTLSVSGDHLRIDSMRYQDDLGMSAACTVDEARARGTNMMCRGGASIRATKAPLPF